MAISLQTRVAFTQDTYKIEHKDQQETYECDQDQMECHFRLEIEELHIHDATHPNQCIKHKALWPS